MSDINKKRYFTILVVPHTEEATFSLRFPLYVVQALVVLLVLGVSGFCVLGYAYLKASAEAHEVQALRQINRTQKEEIDMLAIETHRMMEQMKEIDELVDLVTEKLELEAEVGVGLQSQAGPRYDNAPGNTDFSDSVSRLYESRSTYGGVVDRAVSNISLLQSVIPEHSEALDAFGDYIEELQAKPSVWPTRGRLSSGFGMRAIPYSRNRYQFHTGVDIIGAHGSPVWAVATGRVTFTGYRGSLGNLVIIDHDYGFETYYAHLSGFAVSAGELVKKGQPVGYMGASGRTTGTHLHYEVHSKGTPVNPANYMIKQLMKEDESLVQKEQY